MDFAYICEAFNLLISVHVGPAYCQGLRPEYIGPLRFDGKVLTYGQTASNCLLHVKIDDDPYDESSELTR